MVGLKRQRIMETHGSLGNKHESARSITMKEEHVKQQLKVITGNGNVAKKIAGL